jgi:hypothetical protein
MLADPRWTFLYGDGRRLLARETRLYDVIEADAILPEGSHSGLLYSAEFLESVRRRLAPGGLYVQWAPTARAAETFVAVFPHALLLMPAAVLIGANDPIQFDAAALRAAFRAPDNLAHLRAGNARDFDWATMFAGGAHRWEPGQARAPAPLTDVFPRDEFYLNNPIAGTDRILGAGGRVR